MVYVGLIGDFIPYGPAGIIGDTVAVTALGSIPGTVATQFSPHDLELNYPIHEKCVEAQLEALLKKPLRSIKIGVIQDIQHIKMIGEKLKTRTTPCPIVINIILYNNKGLELINPNILEAYEQYLFPLCEIVILGLTEAEKLANIDIFSLTDLDATAKILYTRWEKTLLVTGSLLKGTQQYDIFISPQGTKTLSFSRLPSHTPHMLDFSGTSVLSCAVAVGLAQGLTLLQAINLARQYIEKTISTSTTNSEDPLFNLSCTINRTLFNKQAQPYQIVE